MWLIDRGADEEDRGVDEVALGRKRCDGEMNWIELSCYGIEERVILQQTKVYGTNEGKSELGKK